MHSRLRNLSPEPLFPSLAQMKEEVMSCIQALRPSRNSNHTEKKRLTEHMAGAGVVLTCTCLNSAASVVSGSLQPHGL